MAEHNQLKLLIFLFVVHQINHFWPEPQLD